MNDETGIYQGCAALKDSLDAYGIPSTFFSHGGGHAMPYAFKQAAFIFLDSIFNIGKTNVQEKMISAMEITIFPNPTNEKTTISFKLENRNNYDLIIHDQIGQEIKRTKYENIKGGSYVLNCLDYPSGIYYVTLQSDSGILTKKLIIE